MAHICILTDSTAQMPSQSFVGHELVKVIPMHILMNCKLHVDSKDLKLSSLPTSTHNRLIPKVLPPSPDDFREKYIHLTHKYNEIVVILISSHLSSAVTHALVAAETYNGAASIHVIDSQNAAVGLGLLVQVAAEAAHNGYSSIEISRLIRGLVPRVYTVFCLQSLTYLYHSGHLDPAQAIIGEMLGVTPFFILENGRLVPVQKIRNSRHLVDLLNEFVSEFTDLKHIAVLHGLPPFEQEVRSLRERINGNFPIATYSEHTLGTPLAAILGPRCLGVVAMENTLA